MKSVLAVVALALVALVVEERARQVAGEAQEAYGEAVAQARDATKTLSRSVKQRPLPAILMAAGVGYVLAALVPRR
ncbi:MAG TPA: hypothetical protein VGG63_08165 [Steroidobacteraceae bacterium]|jgi:ElaB/YqjD/DUF883 family membrane-anchored ribosome-binding protein